MHQKRQRVPNNWPIPRKGNAFVVGAKNNPTKGVPILVGLRDMLKLTQNRKETKKVLHEKLILLNQKTVKDERNSILLYDILTIVPSKTHYKLVLSDNGKFRFKEAKDKDAGQKLAKIVNKKTLKGKKVQLNLHDGRNFLSDLKCKTNDSVVVNFKENKISKCLSLKEKSRAMVLGGKHAGKIGVINKLDSKNKKVNLNVEKRSITVLIKHLMVVE